VGHMLQLTNFYGAERGTRIPKTEVGGFSYHFGFHRRIAAFVVWTLSLPYVNHT